MHKKFGEVWPRSFQVMQVDRETNTQTSKQTYSSQNFAILPRLSNNEFHITQHGSRVTLNRVNIQI